MQSEPILQYLFARKDILQNSLSKNPLQIIQARQAEDAKRALRAKEEKSRQAEEEKSPQGEEENLRQVNLLRQENENENEREHNSRAVQQRSVDWDSPVFSNDRAKNLTIVHQWMAEKSAPSKRFPCSHTNSSVFSVPTRPQSLSEDAKVQKEKATRLKVGETSKKESRSLNSSSLFWLLLGASILNHLAVTL